MITIEEHPARYIDENGESRPACPDSRQVMMDGRRIGYVLSVRDGGSLSVIDPDIDAANLVPIVSELLGVKLAGASQAPRVDELPEPAEEVEHVSPIWTPSE